jgi:hypothetical protein
MIFNLLPIVRFDQDDLCGRAAIYGRVIVDLFQRALAPALKGVI